jgi:hypothetical protein
MDTIKLHYDEINIYDAIEMTKVVAEIAAKYGYAQACQGLKCLEKDLIKDRDSNDSIY